MKFRNLQTVLIAMAGLVVAACPAANAMDAAVEGVVRDSSGIPQIDVLVQLLRADSTVLQSVRTDGHGHFLISGLIPGVYQLKAMETSFLPTLRENLRVGSRGRTEANLTLSTLFEALQWLPAQKRAAGEPEDDWAWTLRSAAYRPLLRFAGPDDLETVDIPEWHVSQHRGRVILESGTRAFAAGGAQETAEFLHHTASGAGTLLRANISDSAQGTTAITAGYARAGSLGAGMSTVLAYQASPGITSGTQSGMHIVQLRSAETVVLTPDLKADAGAQMEMAGIGATQTTVLAPFARVSWSADGTELSYVIATVPQLEGADDLSAQPSLQPTLALRNGAAAIEHGTHQELKVSRSGDSASASLAIYSDHVQDPFLDAMGSGLGGSELASLGGLLDAQTGIVRMAGANYSAEGVVVQLEHRGPGATTASLSYSTGDALALADAAGAPSFKRVAAQAATVALRGKSVTTGTVWRASYRWQPVSTLNAVDLFDSGVADAYLSVFLRQPLHLSHVFPGNVDAIVNVRNLLAQGYHPFLTQDGSEIFFAQVDRSVQGGLTFYF